MGRVEAVVGVGIWEAKASTDERGSTSQILSPSWSPSRVFVAHNKRALTLRGLHYQKPGAGKVVMCMAGIVFDVLVDLRPESPTHCQWMALSLSPGSGAVSVPAGVAHGYMTLTPQATLVYVLEGVEPDDCGVRWDDRKIGIEWPAEPAVISERDRAWELL